MPQFADYGAVRIQMLGVDHRHQGNGHGCAMTEAITGVARRFSDAVAVRVLLADANIRQVEWYEARGFVRNNAEVEIDRVNPERVVSMRLDLI